MKSAAQRIAKYEARMLSSLIDPVLAVQYQNAVDNFTAYELEFYPKQLQLRALLNSYGLPTTMFGAYEAFNGEMFHLYKTTAGNSAIAMATILVAKYLAWLPGHDAHLKEVCQDLYSIIVP